MTQCAVCDQELLQTYGSQAWPHSRWAIVGWLSCRKPYVRLLPEDVCDFCKRTVYCADVRWADALVVPPSPVFLEETTRRRMFYELECLAR